MALARAKCAHLDQTQQVGYRRLRTSVLIGAVRMETVPGTSAARVDQRSLKVVGVQKTIDGAHCACHPFGVVVHAPCRKGRPRSLRLPR